MGTVARGKVLNDPIHGHIELPPLCMEFVDTPHFQRLRNIKQLGTCYLVYPGASHNRFEHSLGVCYLAGRLLKVIKDRQPELLTDEDILCVQIAGLCHDLGQGPFSHLFEKKFIHTSNKEWKHEEASEKMFHHMLYEVNNGYLHEKFTETLKNGDIDFIKEMINPPPDGNPDEWPYKGRGKEKGFLYQVVTNTLTGIDVDRWDYLARDSYMLGMKNIFDFNRCIAVARVLTLENGRTQICFRDKEAQDIYDMFYTRMTLHRRAYQHKTHNIIGTMVCDALREANHHLTFVGMKGKHFTLAQSINDMEAYSMVTDDILYTILQSDKPQLKRSQELLNDVLTRKLYKCMGQTQIKHSEEQPFDESKFKEDLLKKIKEKHPHSVEENHIVTDVMRLNFGMEDKDPIKNVRFYTKKNENDPIEISKDQVSYVLPDTFSEQIVRVYCRSSSEDEMKVVTEAFCEWCDENGHPPPKDK